MLYRKSWGHRRLLSAVVYVLCAAVPVPLAIWIAYLLFFLMGPLGLLPGLLLGGLILAASGWLSLQSWRAWVDFRRTRFVPELFVGSAATRLEPTCELNRTKA